MSFIDLGGTNIHYQCMGAGETTVVFLHGLIMDNLSSWFFTLANPVSQSARVLLYDLRGHGFSDRPKENYSIDQHLKDLWGLLQELKIETPLILVGNSFGGLLALSFARKFPDRIRGLILVDAQINDLDWKEKMLKSLCSEGEERDHLIGVNFQNWLGRNSSRKSNRLAQNAQELIHQTSLVADLQGSPIICDEDLRLIKAPTLAIYGGDSDIISVAFRLESLIPSCRVKVFAGSTHSVLWERTEPVKTLILDQVKHLQRKET